MRDQTGATPIDECHLPRSVAPPYTRCHKTADQHRWRCYTYLIATRPWPVRPRRQRSAALWWSGKARPPAIATGGRFPAEYRTERISGTLAAIAALVPGI